MKQPPTLWKRLCSPTPRFFKKIMRIGGALVAVGTFLSAGIGFEMPADITQAGKYLFVAGSVMVLVAKAAITDKTD